MPSWRLRRCWRLARRHARTSMSVCQLTMKASLTPETSRYGVTTNSMKSLVVWAVLANLATESTPLVMRCCSTFSVTLRPTTWRHACAWHSGVSGVVAGPRPKTTPTGEALALAACDVKERDGVRATAGGSSMLARQMLHSCSRRWTTSKSRRAKACLKPPECVSWRATAKNRATSCQSSWRTSGRGAPFWA